MQVSRLISGDGIVGDVGDATRDVQFAIVAAAEGAEAACAINKALLNADNLDRYYARK